MDNPDTHATLGTQDTGRRQTNIRYTRHRTKTNKTLDTQDTGRRQTKH
jgi:hypothetical protein